jgi:hypothetical protein
VLAKGMAHTKVMQMRTVISFIGAVESSAVLKLLPAIVSCEESAQKSTEATKHQKKSLVLCALFGGLTLAA